MICLEADMWTLPASAHVITTNGYVNANGEAVMGRGCARQARDKFPGLAKHLGDLLTGRDRNHVHELGVWRNYRLISFPVKHRWDQKADPELIVRSAGELVDLINTLKLRKIVIPRPGCGNGQLQWKYVKPLLLPIFDDRFVVVNRKYL